MSDQPQEFENVEEKDYFETKLVTVSLNANGELNAQMNDEFFSNYSEEEVQDQLENILLTVSSSIREQAEEISKDEENKDAPVVINGGSLYDDLIFEIGIYLTSDGELLINPSFGKQCNYEASAVDNLSMVSDALKFIAEQFKNGQVQKVTTSVAPAEDSDPFSLATDDSVKSRF